MVSISKIREIYATLDTVWDIISDIDNDQKYWTNIRDIKILTNDGRTIEREVTAGPVGFSQKSRQTIVLDPKKSIKLTMISDQMTGERTITLVPVERNVTRVDVLWNIEVKNAPGFVQGIMKNQISSATEMALAKIAEEAEHQSSL